MLPSTSSSRRPLLRAALGLAVLLCAAQSGLAQTPPNPVDPTAIQALKDMGAHLQSLKRFQVSTDLTGERVLADGQKEATFG